MKSYRLMFLCFLAGAALLWFLSRTYNSKRYYQGKSARDWVLKGTNLYYSDLAPETRFAISQLGSNAVPDLLALIENTNASWQERVYSSLLKRLPARQKAKIEMKYPVVPFDIGRDNATEALEIIGPDARAAIPALIRDLDSPDPQLPMLAERVLGRIGSDAFSPLLDRLQLINGPPQGCQGAMYALGSLGPRAVDAVPALLVKLDETNYSRSAENVLARIGTAAVPVLLDHITNNAASEREKATRVLPIVGPRDHRVLSALITASSDPEPRVRAQAMKSLGGLAIDDASAVPPLMTAFKDDDLQVRLESIKAVGHAGRNGSASVPQLVEFLAETNSAIREQACLALGRIGQPAQAGIPAITALVNDAEDSVRMAATVALMALKPTP